MMGRQNFYSEIIETLNHNRQTAVKTRPCGVLAVKKCGICAMNAPSFRDLKDFEASTNYQNKEG
jgi:hypothetical protein